MIFCVSVAIPDTDSVWSVQPAGKNLQNRSDDADCTTSAGFTYFMIRTAQREPSGLRFHNSLCSSRKLLPWPAARITSREVSTLITIYVTVVSYPVVAADDQRYLASGRHQDLNRAQRVLLSAMIMSVSAIVMIPRIGVAF